MRPIARLASIAPLLFILTAPLPIRADETVRVAIRMKPLEIIELPVEHYLLGVLAHEVPSDWPLETLKAQAIASRTYALYRKRHPRDQAYDLRTDVIDQVFRSQDFYPPQLVEAVTATEGKVLWWHGEPIPAFFHSCCGGHTEAAGEVWSWAADYPFFTVKEDPFCRNCPSDAWEYQVSKEELSLLLHLGSLGTGEVNHLVPRGNGLGTRIQEVALITSEETIRLSSDQLRELLGYDNLKSTAFSVIELGNAFVFLGEGSGHGVGLCQWGAYEMGRQKKTYQDILGFYYPGVAIKKLY